jgi:thiosulfate/3-mercaptopyruvate sulfurtransferase
VESTSSTAILVDTQQLQDQLEDPRLLLIDSREPSDYQRGHLQGAVNLPPSSMEWSVRLADGAETHHLLAPVERIAPLLSFLGINRESRLVVYDDGAGYTAARVFWILDYFAHPQPLILHGGLSAWKAAGGKLVGKEPTTTRGDFIPDPDPTKIADFHMVRSIPGRSPTVLLNTLPAKSFRREAIPGSLNIPYTEIYRDRKSRLFLHPRHLTELFRGSSITPDRQLILYCGIGYTASLLYFAFRLLGYPRVRLYDGSLADWKARGGALEPGKVL